MSLVRKQGETIWDMVFRLAKQEWKHPKKELMTTEVVQLLLQNYDRLVDVFDGNGKWFFTYLPNTPNKLFEHGPDLDRKMLGYLKMQRVLEDGGMCIMVVFDAERRSLGIDFNKYEATT